MASLKYVANSALQTVTLDAGGYTAGSGVINLQAGDGALLPANGDFWIRSVTPYSMFKVTARAVDVLTVVAGQDGTADVNLAAGAVLHWALGVDAFDQFRVDISQSGPDASKVAEKAGNLYLPNDSGFVYRDNGATFDGWGPVTPCPMPDFSAFTQLNIGPATIGYFGRRYVIMAPASAGNNIRLAYTAAPPTPYSLEVGFNYVVAAAGFNFVGPLWRQSSNGRLEMFGPAYDNIAGQVLWGVTYTSPTGFNAIRGPKRSFQLSGAQLWIKLTDDGVNRTTNFSTDGFFFTQVYSFPSNDFLVADQIGIGAESNNALNLVDISVFSWKVY